MPVNEAYQKSYFDKLEREKSRMEETTEVCPSCGEEITLWRDVGSDGYAAYCPRCGERLMLCSACADDGYYCDYNSATDTCRHSVKRPKKCESAKRSEAPEADQSAKADGGKPVLTLVPVRILYDIAEVRAYGVRKYGDPENWRKVDMMRYVNALYRHLLKFIREPDGADEESGISHYKHMACNMAFICEQMAARNAVEPKKSGEKYDDSGNII